MMSLPRRTLSTLMALTLTISLAAGSALASEPETLPAPAIAASMPAAVDSQSFLAAVEQCVNRFMASSAAKDRQAVMGLVEELLNAGKLDQSLMEFYYNFFQNPTNVGAFIKDFNGMLKSVGLHGYTVGAAVDPSLDRYGISRWLEAGDGERYYTYGASRAALPAAGVPYARSSKLSLTAEQHHQVSRLLGAGYPLDLYGLAGEYAPGYSNMFKSMITQEVLHMLLGQIEVSLDDPYVKALYDYATGSQELEPIGKATVDLGGKAELLYDENTGIYTGAVTLSLTGSAEAVTVTEVPQGATVLVSGNAVKAGDTFDPAELITVTTDGKSDVTGSFSIRYVSYQIVNDTLGEFTTGNLLYVPGNEEAKVYTPLLGYQLESVHGSAELTAFDLQGGPEPEKPVISTIDFAYVTPDKDNAAAAPEGVSVPQRQSQENTTIKYSEPTPLHGSGTIPQGYEFHGWYADQACTQKVASGTVTESTTFYGYWTKSADPVQPPQPENPGTGGGNRPTPPPQPEEPDVPEVDIPEEEPPLGDLPETDIPEEDTPLAPLPEPEEPKQEEDDVVIVDPETPLGKLPQTGTTDHSAAVGLLALVTASAAALASFALRKKKES